MPSSNNWIATLVKIGVELHSKALGHCRVEFTVHLQYCQIGFNKSTSHMCRKTSVERMMHNWKSEHNLSKVFSTHQWPPHICRNLANFKIWYVFLGIIILGLAYPFLGGGEAFDGLKFFYQPRVIFKILGPPCTVHKPPWSRAWAYRFYFNHAWSWRAPEIDPRTGGGVQPQLETKF